MVPAIVRSAAECHVVFVSVGSNIGNKEEHCRSAIDALERHNHTAVSAVSRFYRTEPVDYVDQDWFVNAVVKMETVLEPAILLAELNRIETAMGRERDGVRFGPRVMDLDILLYGDRVIDSPALTVPHPRMHKRRFVLEPICDIAPEVVHPVLKKTMKELLAQPDIMVQNLMTCESELRI